jgi:hypothetical protein
MTGRTILTNYVLNAIPMHYMQDLLLPKWVIKEITQITPRFLWRGQKTNLGGHCLVAWGQITLSKINGGLGILDLQLQNKALLIKWLWLAESEHQCLWSLTLNSIQTSIAITYRQL